jgi:hypothetical protein
MRELKKFYITLGGNHGGPGCVEVHATSEEDARTQAWAILNNKWAFSYESLEAVHPADRKILLYIKGSVAQFTPLEGENEN